MTYFVIKINISVNVINKEIMQRTKQQPTTVKCFPGFPEHLPFPILSVMVAIKRNVCECGSFFFSLCCPNHRFLSFFSGCGQNASWWRQNDPSPTHSSSAACSGPLSSSAPSMWRPPRRGKRDAHARTHTHKYTRAPRYANLCLQSRKILIIYMWESGVTF